MKKCTRCQVEKEETCFFFRNKKLAKLHSHCKDCKREIDRNHYQNDSSGRSGRVRKNSLNRIRQLKEFVQDFKKTGFCANCGDKRWYVLDFHHTRDKDQNISEFIKRQVSNQRMIAEIEKCILLCSNCHREHHYLNGRQANLVEAQL